MMTVNRKQADIKASEEEKKQASTKPKSRKKPKAKEQPYEKVVRDMAIKLLKEGYEEEEAISEAISKLRCNQEQAENIISEIYTSMKNLFGWRYMPKPEKFDSYRALFHPTMRKSELSGRIEIKGEELTERDLNNLLFDLRLFGMEKLSQGEFYLMLNSRYVPQYNPLKHFFETRKDIQAGSGHIKALAESINSDSGLEGEDIFYPQYPEIMVKRWMVGVVASIYGHKNNLYLILVGPQRSGKSEFFRRLFPEELKRFFSEAKLEHCKEADLAMKMAESLIMFDDEMSGKSGDDWKHIKSTLDKEWFYVRKPYGKGNERIKRLSSFCGTTNEDEILGDLTGNRRYLPIGTGIQLDFEKYNAIDKTKLWLEAYQLFKSGEHWELSREEIKMLNECTRRFEKSDEIEETILKLFSLPKEKGETRHIDELTASDIAKEIRASLVKCTSNQVGIRLKKCGFVQKQTNKSGSKIRLYSVCRNS